MAKACAMVKAAPWSKLRHGQSCAMVKAADVQPENDFNLL
jgi:hypothetical protein